MGQIDCEIWIINVRLKFNASELVKGVLYLSEIAFVTVSQNYVPQNIIKTRYPVKIGQIILSMINIGF